MPIIYGILLVPKSLERALLARLKSKINGGKQ